MLILITGVPGSGKSLFAVSHVLQGFIRENESLVKSGKEPRPIYANIDGLKIPGVNKAPDDWRDCPDGSIIIYDECQQRFGPDGAGRSSRPDIQEFETHRHRGMDIVLITQHPKLLHSHVRRLIGKHYHLFRMYGHETAKVFTRDGQMDVDKPTHLNQQDFFVWAYPKEYYGLYNSATIHTHKRHLPSWIKRAFFGGSIALVLFILVFWQAAHFFSGEIAQKTEAISEMNPNISLAQSDQPNDEWQLIESPPPPQVQGCIAMEKRCLCYSQNGEPLDIPTNECRAILNRPLALYSSGGESSLRGSASGSELAAHDFSPPDYIQLDTPSNAPADYRPNTLSGWSMPFNSL